MTLYGFALFYWFNNSSVAVLVLLVRIRFAEDIGELDTASQKAHKYEVLIHNYKCRKPYSGDRNQKVCTEYDKLVQNFYEFVYRNVFLPRRTAPRR